MKAEKDLKPWEKLIAFPCPDKMKRSLSLLLAVVLFVTSVQAETACVLAKKGFIKSARVIGLKAAKKNNMAVKLRWKSFKRATGYQIFRSAKSTSGFHKIGTVKHKISFTDHLAKQPGEIYSYKVRAYHKSGKRMNYSKFSRTVYVQAELGTSPSATAVRLTSPSPAVSLRPSASPTRTPAGSPSASPSASPTRTPAGSPSASPSASPTRTPTGSASVAPPEEQTTEPSKSPSASPSASPAKTPAGSPSVAPSEEQTPGPSKSPLVSPSEEQTTGPSKSPSAPPPSAPSPISTKSPSASPSVSSAPSEEPSASPVLNSYHQDLAYTEVTDTLLNPDQGFYRPIYTKFNYDGITYNKNIISASTRLYHLRCDISMFSAVSNGKEDTRIPEAALQGFDEMLTLLYEKDKNAVIRFAYAPGFGNQSNMEPPIDMMVQHIAQLSEVMEKHHDVITAIEVGMIGPWGEMHSSQIAGDKEVNNKLIQAFMDHTTELPVLVRTPLRIYWYLGKECAEALQYTISKDAPAYRLGLYNDGYQGNSNDQGTYTDRANEVPWLGIQNEHLPYGGEATLPDSPLHSLDSEYCLPEMFTLGLSYLNIEWNNTVVDQWKAAEYGDTAAVKDPVFYGKSGFDYIKEHMGYRFVLDSSDISYDDCLENMEIKLSLNSKGFGNLLREKKLTVIFVPSAGASVIKEAGTWHGDTDLQCRLTFDGQELDPEEGYDVYLRIDNGDGHYAIRFANNLWDADLTANLIGHIGDV